jgi:hypothetical protein
MHVHSLPSTLSLSLPRLPSLISGSWLGIFKVLSVLAVTTNCVMMFITSNELSEVFTDVDEGYVVLIAVLLEHLLIGVQFFASSFINDRPAWLREQERRGREVEKVMAMYNNAKLDPALSAATSMGAGDEEQDALHHDLIEQHATNM